VARAPELASPDSSSRFGRPRRCCLNAEAWVHRRCSARRPCWLCAQRHGWANAWTGARAARATGSPACSPRVMFLAGAIGPGGGRPPRHGAAACVIAAPDTGTRVERPGPADRSGSPPTRHSGITPLCRHAVGCRPLAGGRMRVLPRSEAGIVPATRAADRGRRCLPRLSLHGRGHCSAVIAPRPASHGGVVARFARSIRAAGCAACPGGLAFTSPCSSREVRLAAWGAAARRGEDGRRWAG
jgi:hypothetical protein